jgi:chromosomal replication initiation ATPase DnaA
MGDQVTVKKEDIYRTVDQRILGTEQFVEDVMGRHNVELSQERKAREYSMEEIAGVVEKVLGIRLEHIRKKSKSREISRGRQIISIVANEYGYKGKEIAEFIHKDAAMITRHLKEKGRLKKEIANVIEILKRITKYQ